MKINKCFALLVACTAVPAVISGCGSSANSNNSSSNTVAAANRNSNMPPEKMNEPELTLNADTSPSSGSLATPTEAYKTAYEIRKKKDGPGLKRVLSKEMLEFFVEIGKSDKKSIDDMLQELAEKPQGSSNETRNEKITGNTAVVEYRAENNEWKTMDFVKENGEWKLTMPKADKPGPPKKS